MMESQSDGRQVQRTQMLVLSALLELLNEITYDRVTIQQVCDRANVGRSTFYAHFQSKDDLLRFGFDQALSLFVSELAIDSINGKLEWNALPFLQHVRGHFNLYRTLLLGTGYTTLTQDGVRDLASKISERISGPLEVPVDFIGYMMASSGLSLIKFWLDRRMPESPEVMNAYFQQLIVQNLRSLVLRK